ncbi:hypothetical protein TRFO_06372 [Tritrichomonas foetus]|uniref:Ubiquitin-like domain-containing protein n=1 Tax=Tritrichomonas foetus TaxID=1144522 RepID=A0A1J4JZ60_9EUKA|nr:hypothetical protein TRFO_06372 [Tritrichomonas foetus]|eukprot:OHT04463.1 hypothetical protein TRFO_06372 [Tritrichomonas foetus]
MITVHFSLPDNKPFDLSFDITATVRTAKEFLSYRFKTIKDNITLSNGNTFYPDDLLLTELSLTDKDVVQVSVSLSRNFRFLQPGKQTFDLPFRESATIGDAKVAISPKLKVIPERISLLYEGQDLLDDIRLTDLNIPYDRFIAIEIADDQIPTKKYMFMLQGEAREIPFSESTTLAEVKASLFTYAEKGTASIDLFFDGRPLKDDEMTLSEIRIPNNEFIIAQTNPIKCNQLRDKNANQLPEVEARPDTPINEDDIIVEGERNSRRKLAKNDGVLANMVSQVLQDAFAIQPPEREHDPPPDPVSDGV